MFALTSQHGGSLWPFATVGLSTVTFLLQSMTLLTFIGKPHVPQPQFDESRQTIHLIAQHGGSLWPFPTVGLSTVTFLLQSTTLLTFIRKPYVPQPQFDESRQTIHPSLRSIVFIVLFAPRVSSDRCFKPIKEKGKNTICIHIQ